LREAAFLLHTRILAWLLGVALTTPAAQAAVHYQRLRSFGSSEGDGQRPPRGVVEGKDGALYCTTEAGGTNGSGTVFKLNKDGSGYTVLYNFGGADDHSGAGSPNGLHEASDRVLYGTTKYSSCVFRINEDGSGYKVLHRFGQSAGDGQLPVDGMFEGSDGALYGTTWEGGTGSGTDSGGNPVGSGTVFKLNKDGSGYNVLYSFGGQSVGDGQEAGALVEGSDGALYGTTWFGGIYTNGSYLGRGFGTAFKLNRDGSGYQVLHRFGGSVDDVQGPGPLVSGSDGTLYGATAGGSNSVGTIFKLDEGGGGYSVLYSFDSTIGTGWEPGTLLEVRKGLLYGTTWEGSTDTNFGTVFKLNEDGSGYQVLYRLGTSPGDGPDPRGLTQGSDGVYYGTTAFGGDLGFGTVFKLWPPETPDLIGVTNLGNTLQVGIAGISGFQYQVLRSADLTNWSVLTNLTMPPGGVYTHMDKTPPKPAAFYRAVWSQ
jgi:uncharacterized repeat protein (TIGR03803 family)